MCHADKKRCRMANSFNFTTQRIIIICLLLHFLVVVCYLSYAETSQNRRLVNAWFMANNEAEGEEFKTPLTLQPIPKILHQVFASDMVHSNYRPMIASCLRHNPDWRYYLWRDTDAEALIADRFPSFVARYRQYGGNALQRSDSIRYIVLYLYGGIYLDMDVECVQPFFPALANLSAFLDRERTEQTNILWGRSHFAMNSVMGGSPGHPFYRYVIEAMLQADIKLHAVFSTGPALVTQVFDRLYLGANTTLHSVKLLEAKIMSPLLDVEMNWRSRCNGTENAHKKSEAARSWKERGCIMLRSKNWSMDDTDSSTLAIHRFLHLGYVNSRSPRGKPINITQEFSPRVRYYLQERALISANVL